jgi:hypothetical protein
LRKSCATPSRMNVCSANDRPMLAIVDIFGFGLRVCCRRAAAAREPLYNIYF